VEIRGPDGAVVTSVSYDDTAPWPADGDGSGYSIVPVNSDPAAEPNDPNDPAYWRLSAEIGGSPGLDDIPLNGQPMFKRGEVNADGTLNIADAIALLGHLFGSAPVPPCQDASDANDDGNVNIADAIAILGHLFGGAGPLPEPFLTCAVDPTADTIDCAAFPPCAMSK
jgi:hypothetical protein